ncbi:MAG TPA: hypothetical protein VNS09_05165 [Solirubrobacter sp.]|nr:hypothetical protein [Solirubrobacter sp.]
MSRRGAAALCLLVVLLVAATGGVARADGDPASDVLIKEKVFYPYQVKLPRESSAKLEQTIASLRKKGYPVRVALIANDFDLGSAGMLYRKPQVYAQFLAQELAQFHTEWVLIVMPNGYGIYRCVGVRREGGYVDPCEKAAPMGADQRALRALPTQEASRTDFAAAADVAVRRLGEVHGAKLGGPPVVLIAGLVVLVLAGGAAFLLVRRRRGASAATP